MSTLVGFALMINSLSTRAAFNGRRQQGNSRSPIPSCGDDGHGGFNCQRNLRLFSRICTCVRYKQIHTHPMCRLNPNGYFFFLCLFFLRRFLRLCVEILCLFLFLPQGIILLFIFLKSIFVTIGHMTFCILRITNLAIRLRYEAV